MRIFFLLLQAFILMTLGAAVASLLNEFALHIGGATSQALILLCLLADGGVLFSGPFVALAAAMFIFLLLSGYRMLRWTRWLGVALNLGLIWLGLRWDFPPFLISYFACNCLMLALVPTRPNMTLTLRWGGLLLDGLWGLLVLLCLLTDPPGAAPLTLACVLPLVFLFRANQKAAQRLAADGVYRPALKTFAVTALITLALALLVPLLAPFAGLSCLFLFFCMEMQYLHPNTPPSDKSRRALLVRLLGRMPAVAA